MHRDKYDKDQPLPPQENACALKVMEMVNEMWVKYSLSTSFHPLHRNSGTNGRTGFKACTTLNRRMFATEEKRRRGFKSSSG